MESEQLDERFKKIEAEMKERREARHDWNQHISNVIDQLRLEVTQTAATTSALQASITRLVSALEGGLGFAGIAATQREQGESIQSLQNWQRDIKGFIAGIIFIAATAGGMVTMLIHWVLSQVK